MISLVIVNYRTSALTRKAIRSARAASAVPLQVIVVDNSCDAAEAEALQEAADTLVVSESNRGYAGGINDGRRHCSGDLIIVANPDVEFGERSLDILVGALEGAAIAGPALFWDSAFRWHLPPAEVHSTREVADAALASRSRVWSKVRDRRRFRCRLAFWARRTTIATHALSGAVLAIRAREFDAVGGFDERFRLYFEETDLIRRFSEAGRRVLYVPEARCQHLYNQSAGREPEAAALIYAESERLFLQKWSGPLVSRLLKGWQRPPPPLNGACALGEGPIELPSTDVVVEASPLASFETAAGYFPTSTRVEFPEELWANYRSPELYLRVLWRDSGEPLAAYVRRRVQSPP